MGRLVLVLFTLKHCRLAEEKKKRKMLKLDFQVCHFNNVLRNQSHITSSATVNLQCSTRRQQEMIFFTICSISQEYIALLACSMYHYDPPTLLITLLYMALGHVIWA